MSRVYGGEHVRVTFPCGQWFGGRVQERNGAMTCPLPAMLGTTVRLLPGGTGQVSYVGGYHIAEPRIGMPIAWEIVKS